MTKSQFLIAVICYLGSALAYGQSPSIPECQGERTDIWNDCTGRTILQNGINYTGAFKGGKPEGAGEAVYPDGRKYSGDWVNGRPEGKGKSTTTNGGTYEGEFKLGRFHGKGTYSSEKVVYVGNFVEGKPSGQGSETFPDGGKYTGEFKDGKRQGLGTFTYSNGSKYAGEFADGQRSGIGTFFFAEGAKYVGEWKEGKMNGEGIRLRPDGSLDYSGIFQDNKIYITKSVSPSKFGLGELPPPRPIVGSTPASTVARPTDARLPSNVTPVQSKCDAYGFTRGTDAYAGCVQKELNNEASNNACLNKKKEIQGRVEDCESSCWNSERKASSGIGAYMEDVTRCKTRCQNALNMTPASC